MRIIIQSPPAPKGSTYDVDWDVYVFPVVIQGAPFEVRISSEAVESVGEAECLRIVEQRKVDISCALDYGNFLSFACAPTHLNFVRVELPPLFKADIHLDPRKDMGKQYRQFVHSLVSEIVCGRTVEWDGDLINAPR